MANTTIQIKKSATPSATPASLEYGELAINYADGKLFYKASNGAIYSLIVDSYSFATVNANSTLVIADVTGDIFSLVPGDFITITGDAINDRITIGANLKSVYDVANAAYNQANTGGADLSAANNWANTVAVYANNYAGAMANAANAYAASLTPDLSPAFNKANDAYNVANSALTKGYVLLSNSSTTIDGATVNVWSGSFISTLRDTWSGVYNSNNSTALFTFASGGSNVMSVQMDGSLIVGENFVSDALGVVPSYGGWIVASSGIKSVYSISAGTDVIATANLITSNVIASGYIQFADGSKQYVANAPSLVSQSAFNKANTVASDLANTAIAANNYAGAMANSANTYAASLSPDLSPVFTVANAAFGKANSANVLAYNTGIGANNYAGVMANSSNAIADATYIKKTATTQTITGSLEITGNLILSGNATSISTQNLSIEDPLIFLAANNISDIVDIGFIGHYNNGTANVHTGVYRDHASKEYFVFNGLSGEPELVNDIVPYANNMVNAVLNADLRTSNLNLGGANAIVWIRTAFDTINAAYTSSNADYTLTNAAFTVANGAYNNANSVAISANNYAGAMANAANARADTKVASVTGTSGQIFSSGGTTPTVNLISTGVTATTYGGSTQIPVITVDAFGRLTSASNVAVNGMDYPYVNTSTAAANNWANTKLSNATVTLAGALTTTGQITANAQINVTPTGGSEGGEIQLQGSGANTTWSLDAYQNNIRIFTTTGTTVSNLNFFHAGSGFVRMGVNRTDPTYTLDVNGSTNASALLVNGSDISTIYATRASPTFTGTVNMQAAIANYTLTDAANIDWNLNTGQVATVTLAGNRNMNAPTNLRVGTFILHVIQDGVGGRTLTWNSVFKWPAGVAPVLTSTAGRRDLFSFVCDGTNLYGSFLPDVR